MTEGSTTEAITIPVSIIRPRLLRRYKKYIPRRKTAILNSVLKLIFRCIELLLSDTTKEYHQIDSGAKSAGDWANLPSGQVGDSAGDSAKSPWARHREILLNSPSRRFC